MTIFVFIFCVLLYSGVTIFDFKGHIIKIMLEIVLNNLKVAKIKVFAWISRSFLSNVVNLWISNMAAIINFGHDFKFYGSDVKNYHKNGYFAPENVYIDGYTCKLSIFWSLTHFSKIMSAILNFFIWSNGT